MSKQKKNHIELGISVEFIWIYQNYTKENDFLQFLLWFYGIIVRGGDS